ncbi:CHAT domain-containing protein [Nostoc sp. TCL240-02]|uniref:CHAT domain-containing tetratricopeptide repeat protein n=1 Tax=Nostoc sp. TCL240-02 TaxID=2572090 RepID=UPI0020C619AC|nr:CHAT domain-containing protein [Nostoc sp. TCL240-02]
MDKQGMQAYVKLIKQLLGCATQWLLGLAGHFVAAVLLDYNLEQAIAAYQFALQVYTHEAFRELWALTQYQLAVAYGKRIKGESIDNVELAISAYELALQVYTREAFPQQWAMTQNNLAVDYLYRIKGERADNLELAIAACELALQVYTRKAFPQDWARTQNNLANAYRERIKGERADNLELAIAACELALQVYTRKAFPQDWARTQNNLANAYLYRIKGGKADNLEQAISAHKLALQVYTREAFPQDWAQTQNNLANAYRERIKGVKADNLELAIAACELALEVYTRETFPQSWAQTQNSLANAYLYRIKGEKADNLELAVSTYKLVLQVYTHEAFPQNWALTQNNLAIAYRERIKGERADNLDLAVSAYELALQVRTCEAFPQDWAQTHNNLAIAYLYRVKGDRADNIELAIAACELALQVYTHEAFPQDWAHTQNDLAIAYRNRIKGDRADNIELAIAACELALQVYTRGAFPQDWAQTHNNLANAYLYRIKGEKADNLELAISAYELALQVRTREAFPQDWAQTRNNLAVAYSLRIKGERADNLEQAITAYELALQVYTHEAFPKDCQMTARNLGILYFEQQTWVKAASAYTKALEAGEILYQSAILLDGKAAELAEINDLPRLAAYALARSGDLQAAVLTLEQGRARGLSESLDRDRADLTQLQQLAPSLYTQYANTTIQLRNLETQQRLRMTSDDRHSLTPEVLRTEALQLRQTLTEIIDQIHQVPGYEDFLAQPSFDDIYQALRPSVPLVYLVPTSAGSFALIVTQDCITNIWFDDFTEANLRELLYGRADDSNLGGWLGAYRQPQSNHQAWLDAIDQGTRQLWEPVMSPLINHLQQRNFQQATLIPTGILSLLPLHAAWVEDSTTPTGRYYALDAIHFTYAPNARSLSTAQEIAQRTFADSILAIDEPKHDGAKPLPNSTREVKVAVTTFQNPNILRQEQATREAVLAALPHYKILHCSCHGNAELEEPLKSGLAMTGEGEKAILTLRDLLNLKLVENNQGGIRLAILSACETALAGIELADEAISLPTGLLQAGVAGVVASLWSVSEISTMVLLTRFYTLWRDQHLEPSKALITAQKWLRDAEPRDIVAHCETFIPELASKKGDLYRSLKYDYSHPYYWAAFSYTGV